MKSALGACGYQSWTFEKALKKSKPRTLDSNSNRTQGGESRRYNTTIPYVSKLSEKIRRIYREYQLPVSFKPYNTLRQKLVHPKDKTPKDKQNNIVYGFRCQDNGCEETYIGETKQTLGKRMYQHRRASTSGCGDQVTQLCILIWTVLTTPLTTRTLSFWTESQGGSREELRRRYMLSANSHHSIKEGVCVTIWRGPTVQLSRRSLNVSRVRRPRPRVNNLIYHQSIRWSEDAPRKGCETSPLLENVSPVTRL